MTDHNALTETLESNHAEQRRRFLRLAGTAAALLPVSMISGCGDEAPAPAPAPGPAEPSSPPPRPAAQQSVPAEPEPAPQAPSESADPASNGELPDVDLNDPTAQALGYQHDAANIDPQRFSQRQPDQFCRNCTLFQGREGDAWGPCNLFPGKKVSAGGWCSAYTPRPA